MTYKINDNWYESFFHGINCELWLKAIPKTATTQEIKFIIKELNLKPGQKILDAPCGYGRHAVELALHGYKVTGIDISKTFIDILQKRITDDKLSINAIQADILSTSTNTDYSGAICMGNSFGYFDIDKMKVFVQKIANSLTKGSKFIINSGMIAESIIPNFSVNKSFVVDNIIMEITNSYMVKEGYVRSDILYKKLGMQEEHSFKHYVFTLAEVIRLLQTCNFNTVGTYRYLDGKEFEVGDAQIYIVAEKV